MILTSELFSSAFRDRNTMVHSNISVNLFPRTNNSFYVVVSQKVSKLLPTRSVIVDKSEEKAKGSVSLIMCLLKKVSLTPDSYLQKVRFISCMNNVAIKLLLPYDKNCTEGR